MSDINAKNGLAHPDDEPIEYRRRIREYYLALGYEHPYQWAHYRDVPFAPLTKPLSQCRVALITTAALYNPEAGDQGPGAVYNGAAKFYSVYEFDVRNSPDLRISHIAYDRDHTSAEDPNTYLPIAQLQSACDDGIIGELAEKGFGLPTNRSQRATCETDCPELLTRLVQQQVDAAVLVPNCPVCHQSVSLAARHIEAAGIASVVMACAKDIVEYVGVPRMLFSDFPLGNAAGKPFDELSQRATVRSALSLLQCAKQPRTTVQSPQQFRADHRWKQSYSNATLLSEEEIRRRRSDFDRQKMAAREVVGQRESASSREGDDRG